MLPDMPAPAAPPPDSIPRYRLYGEPPAEPELRFVHLETIPDRMRLHNWEVRPHRHDGLSHALLVTAKGGRLTADAGDWEFQAPALILVPARAVHGFRFAPDTDGLVLTMADGFLSSVQAAAADPALAEVLTLPGVLDLGGDAAERGQLRGAFAGVRRELQASTALAEGRPGRGAAIAAHVTLILVAAARLAAARRAAALEAAPSPDATLVARLRLLVEERFREHWPVERYAAGLGVTAGRLNAACRRVAGCSTLQLVHDRLMLEAKRLLLYTGLGTGEIGYALGFEDPAYFSRFFAKRAGRSPLAFRIAHPQAYPQGVHAQEAGSRDGNGLDPAGQA